jgi:hypothetical protein
MMAKVWFGGGVAAALVSAGLVLTLPSEARAEARNSEQVVLSGGGTGSFAGAASPFGFWIWCEADSENGYAGFCHGAVYVTGLGLVKGVRGAIGENPNVEHEYHVAVVSMDGSLACELVNTPPVAKGPANAMSVTCTAPSGGGAIANAVVVVSGPPSN